MKGFSGPDAGTVLTDLSVNTYGMLQMNLWPVSRRHFKPAAAFRGCFPSLLGSFERKILLAVTSLNHMPCPEA